MGVCSIPGVSATLLDSATTTFGNTSPNSTGAVASTFSGGTADASIATTLSSTMGVMLSATVGGIVDAFSRELATGADWATRRAVGGVLSASCISACVGWLGVVWLGAGCGLAWLHRMVIWRAQAEGLR